MSWNNSENNFLKAILQGDIQRVEEALAENANVKSRDAYGKTPLIIVIAEGKLNRIPIAERLLSAGADVNAQNRNGETALIEAVHKDDIEVIQLLLRYEADIHKKDKNGNTALSIAAIRGNKTIEQILKKE